MRWPVKFVWAVVAVMLFHERGFAQSSPGSALNQIAKGNWLKAELQVRKALRKDTLNPEGRYVYSLLFYNASYPRHNVDSAYHYALSALSDFQKSEPRQKEKMKKFPLDSSILVDLRKKIDSVAFEQAKTINSVSSYQYFLDRYTFAKQRDAAVELRNEVAFTAALKTNTYKIFKEYLDQYPTSHRAEEAHRRYEKLLFEEKTKDGKLKSYETFLQEYPSTAHRREAERNIFEISTASAEPEAFLKFTKAYPDSRLRKRAEDILYHLQPGEGSSSEHLKLSDSLHQVDQLSKGYWVAVYKNEKFGFMDQAGKETIAPRFDIIYDDYKCGEIRTDYVITSEGIISRSGEVIYPGLTEEVIELGSGFLKVQDSICWHIVHKSGFRIVNFCVENAKMVAGRFVAYKSNGKWGLNALNGKPLLTPEFEDIYFIDQIIVLVKSGKRSLKKPQQISALADKNSFAESFVVDDVKQFEPGSYLVKNGALEGVIDNNLEFVVPLDRQVLNKTPYGYMTKKNEKFTVSGVSKELDGQQFDEIRFYENWLALNNEKGRQLFSIPQKKSVATDLDSIWFLNHLAFCLSADTLRIFLNSGVEKIFPGQSDLQFIKTSEDELYFYTQEKNKKAVFAASTGARLFLLDFTDIEYFGNSIFMITRDGRKGLVGSDGKTILPIEYAVIVVAQKGFASLFKDKKFGLFDLKKRKLIKPVYERNVKPFRDNIFIAFKDGYSGFIDIESKPLGRFEFEEIMEWNDSTALVKKNFQWMIYDWRHDKIAVSKIKDYRVVINSQPEKILIVHQENAYGVISNINGRVIPSTFSDIVNIGSDEEPLYFTEKNVEEAAIYVVIYYNKQGKLLRRQVFESEEYEEIYCEDR